MRYLFLILISILMMGMASRPPENPIGSTTTTTKKIDKKTGEITEVSETSYDYGAIPISSDTTFVRR